MPETRARDLANLAGAGATSSTVAYHETARGFTLPAGTGTQNQVISSDGDGTTQWKNTLSAPVITDVTSTKGINRYESATDNGGGTFTVTGTDFGSTTGDLTATISSDSSGVTNTVGDISCSSVSGTGGTTAVFTITGAETGFSNWTSSLSSSSIYVKVTKQGLSSNIVALSGGVNTLSGDPTISSVTGTESTTTPSTTSLGSYGGQITGGGQDSNTKLLLNFDRFGGTDIEDSSNTGDDGHKVTANGNATIKSSPFGDGKSGIFFDGNNDELEIANHADILLDATGDYTIEFWLWADHLPPNANSGNQDVLFHRYPGNSANNDIWCGLYYNSGSPRIEYGRYYSAGSNTFAYSLPGILKAQTWHHIAIVSTSGSHVIYIDGKGGTATSISGTNGSGSSSLASVVGEVSIHG